MEKFCKLSGDWRPDQEPDGKFSPLLLCDESGRIADRVQSYPQWPNLRKMQVMLGHRSG